jgi:hypothetical protein
MAPTVYYTLLNGQERHISHICGIGPQKIVKLNERANYSLNRDRRALGKRVQFKYL